MSDSGSPPRENLLRAVMPGVEYRDTSEDGLKGPTLFGHFARFNEWTEINSSWEGRFMERFAPGAFKKTLSEQRDRLRVLFQHGQDPEIGDKPIAALEDVREDDEGAYYEARLFDGLPPLVMDGLRAGQYGASFRFSVMREDFDESARASDYNPDGLPERTVKEAKVPEFGPVTFPAYPGATSGVRSMTDEFILSCIRSNPDGVRAMLAQATDLRDVSTGEPAEPDQEERQEERQDTQEDQQDQQDAPSTDHAELEEAHLSDERRETTPALKGAPIYGMSRKEKKRPWLL